jgi:hypothetical protein
VQLLDSRLTALTDEMKVQLIESMHVLRAVFAKPPVTAERVVPRSKGGRKFATAAGKKQLSHV